MDFKSIINSNDELKKLTAEIKNLKKDSGLIKTQLDSAKEKVNWKDKLNIFTQSEEEKEAKKIRNQLQEKQDRIDNLMQEVISKTLKLKMNMEPMEMSFSV